MTQPPTDAACADEVNRIAALLMETWYRVDPKSDVTKHPASYVANFADMARAVVDDPATRQQPEAGREGELAQEIARVAGCQVGSQRTQRLVDFIRAREAATRLAVPTVVGREEVARVPRLKYYPDYIDDADGLARFRHAVETTPGHDMAAVNHNSLGRLIDTIERLRFERDQALLSHAEAGGVEGWRTDLDDAPRDGTQIDLWAVYDNGGTKTGERLTFCRWRNESCTYDAGWHDCFGNKIEWAGEDGCSRTVTHWMLIPASPAAVAGGGA